MKFRLVYEGDVFSSQNKKSKENTHKIRKHFHYQIKNLLESDRILDTVKNATPVDRAPFNFTPMVWKLKSAPDCSLDILFLRRDGRGRARWCAGGAGDIDNRLKPLVDALTVPSEQQIPCGVTPEQDQEHFYCLFQDDCLVTHLSVEADQWLAPQKGGESESSGALVIVNVNIEPGLLTKDGHLIL